MDCNISTINVLISFVLTSNISLSELAGNYSPIHSLATDLNVSSFEINGVHVVGAFIAFIAVLTLLSTVNAGVLASSRFPFAMSRDGLLPEFWSKVHSRFLTPVNTIAATCIAIALVVLFLDVFEIAKLASAFKVTMFISVNLAVIVLRETAAQWYQPKYKSPFYPWVQIFGIVSGIFFLVFLGMIPLLAIFAIFVLGAGIYFVYGKSVMRSGVLKNYAQRPASSLFAKKEESKKQKAINIKKASSKLDPKIASSAGAIVPLLGNETSPEMLVEMAAAIQSKKQIQALNITEVPSQTDLDVFLEDSPTENSLKRRLSRISKSQKVLVDFEAVVTHELSDTINQLSSQSSCDWLVMGWDGRPTTGIFVTNPIGWLLANINSNLALYRDNGVRYVGKVLLALRPGRKDKNFIGIAKNVCDYFKASLTLLHVMPENSLTTETIKHRSSEKLKQSEVKAEVLVVKSPNPVETISKISAGYDLLILGTPEKDNWIKVLFGGGKDKFTERAACSVLRITLKD